MSQIVSAKDKQKNCDKKLADTVQVDDEQILQQ